MKKFLVMFNNKRESVEADDLWSAKKQAIVLFKPKKRDEWRVIVALYSVDGVEVTHSTVI